MKTGLDVFLGAPKRWLGDARDVGFLGNATAVDAGLAHAVDLLCAHDDVRLVRLFGPEHGVRGEAQDMEPVGDAHDRRSGLPMVSLYGRDFASLAPTVEQLSGLDALIFDAQDVGARYYTYQASMALAMRVAAEAGVHFIVLDRPNPIGGTQVEGGGLHPGLENFCGLYPVPQRHGMTSGELATLYNTHFGIGCRLTVVPCEGWERRDYFDATGLPWVLPSPNMPTLDTAVVYPGMCLLEATQVSEGRGTTRPFELFGAPYVDAYRLTEALQGLALPGIQFRPCAFRPMFQKHARQTCFGAQLHVTSRAAFQPYRTGLAILAILRRLWPEEFAWRQEPYEFRDDVPAIDMLTGLPAVREAIDAQADLADIEALAGAGVDGFSEARDAALLYS